LGLNVNPEENSTPGFVLTTFAPCAIRGIINYERELLHFTEEKNKGKKGITAVFFTRNKWRK